MKAIEKIIIASVVGTSFMTLYSYFRARAEKQEYVEPVMLNKLIDKSKNLPEVDNEVVHPAGWGLHYLAGLGFVCAYWLLWRRALHKPTVPKIIVIGGISGLTGIAVWKLLFAQHGNPPHNHRAGYYRQLLTAHVVFTLFALLTYRALERHNNKNLIELK